MFSNNLTIGTSNNDAGAVYVERFVAPVKFRDCLFVANTNTYSVANRGAGALTINLHAEGAGVHMGRCTFDRNYSPSGAGAVNYTGAGGADSFWSDCVFTGNVARAILNNKNSEMGTFETCIFDDNLMGNGSALLLTGTVALKALFTNCLFRAHRMSGSGNGSVFTVGAPITLLDCRFEGNSGSTSYPRGGGVIYWDVPGSGTGTVDRCAFVANTTVGMGGAIWHKAGSLKIRWSVFSGNTAGAYYESIGGGAISQTGGQLLLSDCTFVSNSTTGHGGAVSKAVYPAPYGEWASPGPGTIERCVFIDNEAGANRYGGAIAFGAFSNYSGRVQNSVFRGNSAGKGGAISTENAHVALSNITAAGNASVMTGYGGTLAHDSPQHSATVVNSIFWDNGTTEIEPTIGVSVSYSDVQDGFAGTGNLDADPRFVDLVYLHLKSTTGQYTNGYFDGGRWATGDAMSPCIDAGDPASDASYEPRPRSGRINLGAYGNTAVASKAIPTGIVIMIR